MKFSKIFICTLLVFSLCSSFAAPAYAEPSKAGDYVSLGDSIFTEKFYENPSTMWKTCSEQSFSWQVADALNLENVVCDCSCMSGARVEELLTLLGMDIPLDAYNSNGGFYESRMESIYKNAQTVQDNVSNADLISVSIGGNNIASYPLMVSGLSSVFTGETKLSVEETAAKVAEVVALIWDGYSSFLEYYPLMLERVRELNPKAQLVVLGLYNPMRGMPLTDDTLLPIGTAVSAVTSLMTENIRQWCEDEKYSAVFVNISDTETWFTSMYTEPNSILGASNDFILYIHPNENGYKYIARQVINTLSDISKPITTDITIDLNGINAKGIVSVLVDGIKADYSAEGEYTLNVKCSRKNAHTVTVTAKSGTKYQLTVWQVAWNDDEGYRVYELAKSDNAAASGAAIAKKADNAVITVTNGLKRLFGR